MKKRFVRLLLVVNAEEVVLQELCSAGYIASDGFDGQPCKDANSGDSKLAEWQTAARRGSLSADLAPAYAKEKGHIVL
jgi:hypothetical protein